jgi:predicted nucleic acid-binding protein
MEQEIPADASSLIYLAKADAFDLAARVARPLLVPPSVWREAVVAGQEVGAPEVPRILVAEGQGLLQQIDLAEAEIGLAGTIASQHRLGSGESEVLAVTAIGRWAIVDEGRATRVARSRGILPISTVLLSVVGYKWGDLRADEAKEFLHRIASAIGLRTDVLLTLERELRRNT